jgi:gamma-glutamylcyclotransferase (GGCT)/AIG2-like uncharacterized protein YtfP
MERELNIMCIKIVVYGSLKRGFWNHEPFCASAISIQHATVRGRLYELPSGIPVLEVPEKDIVAHGSADILKDIAMQRRLEVAVPGYLDCSGEGWQQIESELITLPNPVITLPPIDRLEGFNPNDVSLYRRVLVPVRLSDKSSATAWCYVAGSIVSRMITPTFLTRWG